MFGIKSDNKSSKAIYAFGLWLAEVQIKSSELIDACETKNTAEFVLILWFMWVCLLLLGVEIIILVSIYIVWLL